MLSDKVSGKEVICSRGGEKLGNLQIAMYKFITRKTPQYLPINANHQSPMHAYCNNSGLCERRKIKSKNYYFENVVGFSLLLKKNKTARVSQQVSFTDANEKKMK